MKNCLRCSASVLIRRRQSGATELVPAKEQRGALGQQQRRKEVAIAAAIVAVPSRLSLPLASL